MKRFLIGVFIGWVLLNPLLALAEPGSTLTLDQAIQTAIANNPQFKSAQARIGVSEADILAARPV